MSVAIKGMNMPSNCLECKFKIFDEYEETSYCLFTDVMCLSIGRQDNCPLVLVSDGRIIVNWKTFLN